MGATNPAVEIKAAIAKQRYESFEAQKVSFPLDVFTGREAVALIGGGNNDGKSEVTRVLAFLVALDHEKRLGFDYVLAAARDKKAQEEEGGELRKFMTQVGQLKARIKEMKGRGLIILDEPLRGTSYRIQPQLLAQVVKELREASPDIKVVVVSHSDPKEVEEDLTAQKLEGSFYFVPSRFHHFHTPYSLYPGSIEEDNAEIIGEVLGQGFKERFLYYRDQLRDNQRQTAAAGL